jgi:hypothetical protein
MLSGRVIVRFAGLAMLLFWAATLDAQLNRGGRAIVRRALPEVVRPPHSILTMHGGRAGRARAPRHGVTQPRFGVREREGRPAQRIAALVVIEICRGGGVRICLRRQAIERVVGVGRGDAARVGTPANLLGGTRTERAAGSGVIEVGGARFGGCLRALAGDAVIRVGPGLTQT